MGLSQQVAYSSLLAFFPAMIFLVAFLDMVGAFDALQEFLDPVAPQSVTDIIQQLQQDSGGGSAVLLALGLDLEADLLQAAAVTCHLPSAHRSSASLLRSPVLEAVASLS